MATKVNITSLVDAGVHFGHQTRKWNPKMKPYIFTARNNIYIIDLKQTLIELDKAYSFVSKLASKGNNLLFVGTKKQAQEPVAQCAERCGMPYVNNRWLGGMLTNFVTIRSRVTYMEELEAMEQDGRMAALPKKEQILLRKELGKLQANLNGVRNMTSVPQAIFVVDTMREEIAIHEAKRLGIPVIGILDTNADPDDVEFGIPGNDDAIRSVGLITNVIADAVVAGATATVISEAELVGSGDEAAAAPVAVEPAAQPDVELQTVPAAAAESVEKDEPAQEVPAV
jgi:small subunit ribosomal protein S2